MAAIGVVYKGLTGLYGNLTLDTANTLAEVRTAAISDETLDSSYYGNLILLANNAVDSGDLGSSTLADVGYTANSVFFFHTIQTGNLQVRQERRLDIQQLKRRGGPAADTDIPAYRVRNTYDVDTLPAKYIGNVSTPNTHPQGLLLGRPWVTATLIDNPTTIDEGVDSTTLLEFQAWYDAADTSTLVPSATDEGQITQWNDKSGNEHNTNPDGGSAKPTYESSDTLNGYGYVEFDGTDSLTVNPFTTLASKAGYTVFILAKQSTTSGTQTLTVTDESDLLIKGGTGNFIVGMNGATGDSGVAANTSWIIHSLVYDGTGSTNSDKLLYRINKANTSLSFTGTIAGNTSASNKEFFIGNDEGGSNGLAGNVAEVIMFSKTLNNIEYRNVENYLSTKWGL